MNHEFLKTIFQSWPLAIFLILLIFRKDIKMLLANIKIAAIQISVAGSTIKLSTEDIKSTMEPLFEAMKETLTRDQRVYFYRIISKKKGRLTVYDLFDKSLKRHEKTHNPINKSSEMMLTTLRSLRGFWLIEPGKNKYERWQSCSEINVTRFGHFVSNHPELKKLIEVPEAHNVVTEIDKIKEESSNDSLQPTS